MSSQRLPGKMLRDVHGKPLLAYLIERLYRCTCLDKIVLATSSEGSDDPLAEYAELINLPVYRGSLKNVAQRMLNAAEAYQADAIVRISGDSPMMDSLLVDRMVGIFKVSSEVDMVTNVQKRSFPKGQSIEIFSVSTLRSFVSSSMTAYEREHVTPIFYKNFNKLRIINVSHDPPLGDVQLSIDTEYDFKRFCSILDLLDKPHWQYSFDSLALISSQQLQENE